MFQEKKATSKLATLRQLIDDGKNSGEPVNWNVEDFLSRMKSSSK